MIEEIIPLFCVFAVSFQEAEGLDRVRRQDWSSRIAGEAGCTRM